MTTARNNALSKEAEAILYMDPDVEASKVEQLGIDWADKDADARILEETKKTLLAQLILEAQTTSKAAGGRGMPVNQAENAALADPRYEAHLQAMVAARKAANRAKVRYESGSVRIELMRSLVATRREEMRLGGIRT